MRGDGPRVGGASPDEFIQRLRGARWILVFVPSRDRRGRSLSFLRKWKLNRLVDAHMTRAFGGTTRLRGGGSWSQGGGRVLREGVLIVGSLIAGNVSETQAQGLLATLLHVLIEANQEEVLVVVEGDAFYVAESWMHGGHGHAA